jgi:hypothetical protein
MILAAKLFAQEFTVEKVSGDVLVLHGAEENWAQVRSGQTLNASDFISVAEKSFIQLSGKSGRFILKNNSAVNLSAIKKMSLNELMLALAAEEIRNIPDNRNQNSTKNTAVYGKEETAGKKLSVLNNKLGNMRINGARQLAETGYRESALLVARETYRKYPATKSNIENRLFFIDLFISLKMNNEAIAELTELTNYKLGNSSSTEVESRLARLKSENLAK